MKKWKIEGYAGRNDYDGPKDNNFHYTWELPDSITEEEIEAIITNRFKDERCVAFSITEVK